MRCQSWLPLALLAGNAIASLRDYEKNDYFAVHLDSTATPQDIVHRYSVQHEGQIGELSHHHTFSCRKDLCPAFEDALQELKRRKRRRRRATDLDEPQASRREVAAIVGGILWSEKQQLRHRHVKRVPPPPSSDIDIRQESKEDQDGEAAQQEAIVRLNTIAETLDIKDPIFKEQWHLFNPIQLGHDLNVTGVWLDGITGNGTVSAVIDDGLDMDSNDLKDNYFAPGSFDFNDRGPDPRPRLFDDKHGTRCAGEIAAVRNDVCGVGMAYDGKVAGIRILSKPITDEDEATAINYDYQENHIYSCSWGPPDDGKTMEAPGLLIKRAMVNGIQSGRNGLGSVFVFAAGNGAASEDNCNFDGYTNSIYSITVGGIDRAGNHPYYSEACSAQLVVTYSSGAQDAIHTTDVGVDKCYNGHGGTSAAGPLVVGTVALALSARPDLTWRDVQYLCVDTAIPIHLDDGSWQNTTIGKKFSHTYGYGKVDAYRFVEAAKSFQSVKAQAWYHSPWLSVQHKIPEGDQGLAASFTITQEMLTDANLERLEHVTVTMNVEHGRRGDLSADLISPSGVVSHIATTRRVDNDANGYDDWTFMSVAHWGESGIGKWTVIVKDINENEFNGTFIDWRLNLWGESINDQIQGLHPLPDEHDDDHETASAVVSTTSVYAGRPSTSLPAEPTDHIDRPTKPQPSDSTDPEPTATITTSTTTNSISIPTTITTAVGETTAAASASAEPTHTYSDSFLPSFFPTFGVSKRTQIWIYGSIVLIIIFCVGLGAYFLVQRRKRLRNDPRDLYEFEMVGDADEDEQQGLHPRGGRGKGRARRGGELYDAFAGESEDDLYSDEETYQDTPSADTSTGSRRSTPEGEK
ncbi:pheromone processing endoprotease [Elasticomyces elasticus]|uniref:Pheromone processing endoprotease n=1 Tax=Exophiala sideris TaxID=1016849 RepID=A0ABR0IXZ2_9EURO|nr:pheromone processing endoprotease [Elasticomyces elasticus]KAK5022404.1 pheromone processing endoprotease [Exophiala sideris]KAK5027238.1 pheromone processing endoprotease [Exophiala sideris]KAK5051258.1 pheromone processing endoprotease [Exophiala sideris]KAK5177778.1 pheromone processing endoprotease [Eurotiomycetes sp. CCFEE 6388]